jgi:2',3'-cyclic-nucleotide 2'-phosphodiesterase/3'-nucleotidase/5'-nucleotidase
MSRSSARWAAWVASVLLLAARPLSGGSIVRADITLAQVGTHHAGIFAKSAAEIPALCPEARRLFVVNAESGRVDVLDVDDAGGLRSGAVIDAARDVAGAMQDVNSVSVSRGLLAAAIAAKPATDPGAVAFYDTRSLQLRGVVPAGPLPDMVTFSPDGRWVLVANEGEPNDDCTVDPEGTITIIDLETGIESPRVHTVTFRDWNTGGPRAEELPALMDRGLRHFGRVMLPGEAGGSRPSTFAEDVEPEWIEIDPESRFAYVCLQEANAIAEIDIAAATVTRIVPLGFKDHGLPGNGFDASDRDGGINIRPWPGVYGVFQPDTIRLVVRDGRRLIVTANEGDSRVRPYADGMISGVKEGAIFTDETDLDAWPLEGGRFADVAAPQDLGRLKLVRDLVERHLDADGRPTRLFSFGGRSFSIFDFDTGELVFDSGSDFERITAERYPEHFNASNDAVQFDKRSRSKGPEPEGLAVGEVEGRTYAFVGLERMGGIMVYDITVPAASRFVGYFNNRRFDVPPTLADGTPNPAAGDSGIEGLIFVAAGQSPTGRPLVVAANETSGTTTVWEIRPVTSAATDGPVSAAAGRP